MTAEFPEFLKKRERERIYIYIYIERERERERERDIYTGGRRPEAKFAFRTGTCDNSYTMNFALRTRLELAFISEISHFAVAATSLVILWISRFAPEFK